MPSADSPSSSSSSQTSPHSLVPLARSHSFLHSILGNAGLGRSLTDRMGDRFVQMAEKLLGEELDARLARLSTRLNEVGFDPFGFDPETARYVLVISSFLHRYYFRTEVHNIDRLPEGRCLLIANHSGQVPLDGVMLGTSLVMDAEPPRFPRSMVERWSAELPFVSVFFPRIGQVVGDPDNARRLLMQDEAIVVFPEGARGISKTYRERYQLAPFGLGFVRLALETNTPIVPVAIVGAEEQYPSLANLKKVASLFGMPAMPVLPQLLFGMPLPLPTKYRIHFGEPILFDGDPDDDDSVIEQKVEVVRRAIQTMLEKALKERKSIFR